MGMKDYASILDMTHEEANAFFMESKNYCSIDLPEYYDFKPLLDNLSKRINGNSINSYLKGDKPKDYSNVNYELISNKDGQYAWRPFQLIHPLIYVDLVNTLTESHNWELILNKFQDFKNSVVECSSYPGKSNTDESDKAERVRTWWLDIEQKSLELSLEFEYIFTTDITDCYGAIYTHSIPWAIHGKDYSKKNRTDQSLLGNKIDTALQSMSYGQTNGIPQGSVLSDFIAEIVLGYADETLSQELEKKNMHQSEYKILRYRDDYRIFTKNPVLAQDIAKILNDVLIGLGLKLNTSKTYLSDDIVTSSVKKDKIDWFMQSNDKLSAQKQLLNIYHFSLKHPNSGTVQRAISDFNRYFHNEKSTLIEYMNIEVISSIIVNLTIKNPRIFPIATAILSDLIELKPADSQRIFINRIMKKFKLIPHNGILEIWLQRMIHKYDYNFEPKEPLCKAIHSNSENIWNLEWLQDNIVQIFKTTSIINSDILEAMPVVIEPEEVQLFSY